MLGTIRGKLRNVDRAYLAGFVDGEGSIGIYVCSGYKGRKYHYTRIMIGNTDKEIPQFMKDYYGGGLSKEHPLKGMTIYRWNASGKICDMVLRDIMPYLKQKQERAKLLLQYYQKRKMLSFEEKEEIRMKFVAMNGISGKSHLKYNEIVSRYPQRLNEKTPQGESIV